MNIPQIIVIVVCVLLAFLSPVFSLSMFLLGIALGVWFSVATLDDN